MSLENSVNEVYRDIGRNVMLLQQLEQLLKYVIANGSYFGYVSEVEDNITKKADITQKKTMGQLVGEYVGKTYAGVEEGLDEPDVTNESYISFSFTRNFGSDAYKTKKVALAELVSERNELIHHLLPSFDISSTQSCDELEKKLKLQKDKICIEIADIKSVVEDLNQAKRMMADLLSQHAFKQKLEVSFLRESVLVRHLIGSATKISRSDGWTVMREAADLVKQQAPDELVLLVERYGYKSLKSLMLAVELFDISKEATENGGMRSLYRLKPCLELSQK